MVEAKQMCSLFNVEHRTLFTFVMLKRGTLWCWTQGTLLTWFENRGKLLTWFDAEQRYIYVHDLMLIRKTFYPWFDAEQRYCTLWLLTWFNAKRRYIMMQYIINMIWFWTEVYYLHDLMLNRGILYEWNIDFRCE